MNELTNRRPLIAAGLLLGVGLGGFVDGILFHQLLQWHGMLTGEGFFPKSGLDYEKIAINLQVNMFWDGVFHVITWMMTALGLMLLWRATARPEVPHCGRTLVGSMALGWGLFNLIEGVIDHHILHVHHVTETANHLVWDVGFLASGVLLTVVGVSLIRGAVGHAARVEELTAKA